MKKLKLPKGLPKLPPIPKGWDGWSGPLAGKLKVPARAPVGLRSLGRPDKWDVGVGMWSGNDPTCFYIVAVRNKKAIKHPAYKPAPNRRTSAKIKRGIAKIDSVLASSTKRKGRVYTWDNANGVLDAEGEQVVQLVRTYCSKKERIRIGKLLVNALNKEAK